jgi:pimeloyl-ACP methyl ester carboxylesterase
MPVAIEQLSVPVNGIDLNVAVAGEGPAVLLLHGFPHTWRVWSEVIGPLAERHRVIAPDLRGLGGSSRAVGGYDAAGLATDAEQLLTALGVAGAAVAGIDAGAAPAFLLALRRPDLVRRLVLMEALIGHLPGAEDFLAGGPPWWFGFHSVPGLAETVLVGHEAEYLDWFLTSGTLGRGISKDIRDAFVAAYRGTESLRCAFAHYRALPVTARQVAAAVAERRLTVPVLAIGAHPVGTALQNQLAAVADDLTAHVIEDCGHIIPLDRPGELLALITRFL